MANKEIGLGDEICARKDVLEQRNLQGSRRNKKIVSTMSFSNENGKTIPGSPASVPGQWPNEDLIFLRRLPIRRS
jgi:hypothetical protein